MDGKQWQVKFKQGGVHISAANNTYSITVTSRDLFMFSIFYLGITISWKNYISMVSQFKWMLRYLWMKWINRTCSGGGGTCIYKLSVAQKSFMTLTLCILKVCYWWWSNNKLAASLRFPWKGRFNEHNLSENSEQCSKVFIGVIYNFTK